MNETIKIWLTGDKPAELLNLGEQNRSLAYSAKTNETLERIAAKELRRTQQNNSGKKAVLLTGLELGMEQAAARAALDAGVEVHAYIPYREHGGNWNARSKEQYENLKTRIINNGGKIIFTSEAPEYHKDRVVLRNYQLAEDADRILTLHDPNQKPIYAAALLHAAQRKTGTENIYERYKDELGKLTARREQTNRAEQIASEYSQPKSNGVTKNDSKAPVSNDIKFQPTATAKLNIAKSLESTMKAENKELINPRTARAIAAILGQTADDALLSRLNQTHGRNQSEQASYLGEQSAFIREIYERGGIIHDGILTVPKENSSLPPQMEISTEHYAVAELEKILGDAAKARELAPQLVEAGKKIAGKTADGQTRLLTFQWIYGALKGERDLLESESPENEREQSPATAPQHFSQRWEQIKELSDQIAALEPKEAVSPISLEEWEENKLVERNSFEPDENSLIADIIEQAVGDDASERSAEQTERETGNHGLTAFERIEIENKLPEIPENLYSQDFYKLLEKLPQIDRQLEQGASEREVLRPFSQYGRNTALDNELRLIEQEYAREQNRLVAENSEPANDYRFVATREEIKELGEERKILAALENEQNRLQNSIKIDFSSEVDRQKVERSIQNIAATRETAAGNLVFNAEKIELSDEELLLRETILKEQSLAREIREARESITAKENLYASFNHLASQSIPALRRQELIDQATAVELPIASLLREKYPLFSARQRQTKAQNANTFVIKNPSEYLFVREIAEKHFEQIRSRALKNEYNALEKSDYNKKINTLKTELSRLQTDSHNKNDAERKKLRAELQQTKLAAIEQQEKIADLKVIQPVFAYQIEGSQKIIKGKPSERAAAGYKFVKDYVRYQLAQPETRLRHDSTPYREYAARLEKAISSEQLAQTAHEIRRDNHEGAKAWRTATAEERRKLVKPLSKKEMTLLFTEQSPKHFTGEMTLLKYSFAHYSEAKTQMTKNLLEGRQEPSAEAKKLVASLSERLNRRSDETKLNATKHFFKSLKTPHDHLDIKNKDFDHHAAYQSLPPHEKDFVYVRAAEQKANLEYRIAYFESRSKAKNSAEMNNTRRDNAAQQDFAMGALWFQAASFGQAQLKISGEKAGIKDETAKSIGILLHNQSKAKNLQISDWLSRQNSPELKKAGEILHAFSQAERTREGEKIKVSVKLPEKAIGNRAGYQSLLEQFYPADYEQHQNFKISRAEPFRLENSRRAGQTRILAHWANEAATAVYHPDAPVSVFANEAKLIAEIEKIKAIQIECRRAAEIKNQIAAKYEQQLKAELTKKGANSRFSSTAVQSAVLQALSPREDANLAAKQQKLFEQAQAKIGIRDFENFVSSAEIIKEGLTGISESFETIASLNRANELHRLKFEERQNESSIRDEYEKAQSLAEARALTGAVRQIYQETSGEIPQPTAAIREQLSSQKQAEIWSDSHRAARIALEPKELSVDDLPKAVAEKALALADAIEKAHQLSVKKSGENEISRAFGSAEENKTALEKAKAKFRDSTPKPVTLLVFEKEIEKAERLLYSREINQLLEKGQISLDDLERKKIKEHFTNEQRDEIRLAAIEKAKEKLEPKELAARARHIPENLQRQALETSQAFDRAAQIYSEKADEREIFAVFQRLDNETIKLRHERDEQQTIDKYFVAKNNFKNDLATMFQSLPKSSRENALTAMTKGLTIAAFEQQGLESNVFGISKEKINEVSTSISLKMLENKQSLQEKQIAASVQTVSRFQSEPSHYNHESAARPRMRVEPDVQQAVKAPSKTR